MYVVGLYDSAIDRTTLGWITKGQTRHELDGHAALHEAVLRNRLFLQQVERLQLDNQLLEEMLENAEQPRVITERVAVPDLELFLPVAQALDYQLPNGHPPQEYAEGLARAVADLGVQQRRALEQAGRQVDHAHRTANEYRGQIAEKDGEIRILRALQSGRTTEQRQLVPDTKAELTYAVLSNVLGLFADGEKFVAEALKVYDIKNSRTMAAGGKVFTFGALQPKLWEVIQGVFYQAECRETTGLVERTESYFTAPESAATGNPEWTWRIWRDDKMVDIDQLALALRRSARAVTRTLDNVEPQDGETYVWKDVKGILRPERNKKNYDVRLPRQV